MDSYRSPKSLQLPVLNQADYLSHRCLQSSQSPQEPQTYSQAESRAEDRRQASTNSIP